MKLIYHDRDLDGLMCAAIMITKYPGGELIGWDYSYDPDDLLSLIEDGEEIVMADVSLPLEKMQVLTDKCPVIFIDHHETTKDFLDTCNFKEFIHNTNFSACELAYKRFFEESVAIPPLVRLLGIYDTWRKKEAEELYGRYAWENYVLPVQLYYKTSWSIHTLIQDMREKDNWRQAVSSGKAMLQFEKYQIRMTLNNGHVITVFGKKAFAINATVNPGRAYDLLYEEMKPIARNVDFYMQYYRNQDKWHFSLRSGEHSSNFDVSKVAAQYGGGGHKNAAGFNLDELPEYLK